MKFSSIIKRGFLGKTSLGCFVPQAMVAKFLVVSPEKQKPLSKESNLFVSLCFENDIVMSYPRYERVSFIELRGRLLSNQKWNF